MNDQAPEPLRLYRPTRRERWAFFHRQYGPYLCAFGLIGIVVLGGLCFSVKHSLDMARDIEGRPLHQGMATVTTAAWTPSQKDPMIPRPVELEFNGTPVWTYSPLSFQTHQRVGICYCIGKSGRLYVMNVYPSPPP